MHFLTVSSGTSLQRHCCDNSVGLSTSEMESMQRVARPISVTCACHFQFDDSCARSTREREAKQPGRGLMAHVFRRKLAPADRKQATLPGDDTATSSRTPTCSCALVKMSNCTGEMDRVRDPLDYDFCSSAPLFCFSPFILLECNQDVLKGCRSRTVIFVTFLKPESRYFYVSRQSTPRAVRQFTP